MESAGQSGWRIRDVFDFLQNRPGVTRAALLEIRHMTPERLTLLERALGDMVGIHSAERDEDDVFVLGATMEELLRRFGTRRFNMPLSQL